MMREKHSLGCRLFGDACQCVACCRRQLAEANQTIQNLKGSIETHEAEAVRLNQDMREKSEQLTEANARAEKAKTAKQSVIDKSLVRHIKDCERIDELELFIKTLRNLAKESPSGISSAAAIRWADDALGDGEGE